MYSLIFLLAFCPSLVLLHLWGPLKSMSGKRGRLVLLALLMQEEFPCDIAEMVLQ